ILETSTQKSATNQESDETKQRQLQQQQEEASLAETEAEEVLAEGRRQARLPVSLRDLLLILQQQEQQPQQQEQQQQQQEQEQNYKSNCCRNYKSAKVNSRKLLTAATQSQPSQEQQQKSQSRRQIPLQQTAKQSSPKRKQKAAGKIATGRSVSKSATAKFEGSNPGSSPLDFRCGADRGPPRALARRVQGDSGKQASTMPKPSTHRPDPRQASNPLPSKPRKRRRRKPTILTSQRQQCGCLSRAGYAVGAGEADDRDDVAIEEEEEEAAAQDDVAPGCLLSGASRNPAEWFCCHWSLALFHNTSRRVLKPNSERSITQAEYLDEIIIRLTALKADQRNDSNETSRALHLTDGGGILVDLIKHCFDSFEALMPISWQNRPGAVIAATFLLLLAAGFLANLLLRTKKNAFMLNLAIADILVLTVCAPYSIKLILVNDWDWESMLCKVVPFVQGSLLSVSIWSQASVALYRYMVVCHPISARSVVTARRTAVWIACVWLLSAAVCSPNIVTHKYTSQVVVRQGRRLQTARLFVAMLSAFIICWGPYNSLTLWLHVWHQRDDVELEKRDRQLSERIHIVQFITL
uniref:G_PROTEIN_RECEP_F1_2 domain-containing protein n=1 Tax=Macrostomum lignano TaxID=282301 RepID=A0A1I8JP82_9PLAT